jgi:alpha-amylase
MSATIVANFIVVLPERSGSGKSYASVAEKAIQSPSGPRHKEDGMPRSLRRCVFLLVALAAWTLCGSAQQTNNLVYEVFIRSFADTPSDTAPAGAGEIGDLKGIRENLAYLNDGDPQTGHNLSVGILWLMPVFPATSYHGYDVTDFRAVNPDYGTLQDLDDLIQAAHRRGVRIILDIPFNHTSNQHPWFLQAVEDAASPFRKFYHFASADQPAPPGPWYIATSSSGKRVRYFGLFSPTMPDLNFDEPQVRREVQAIARFWLARGIDGFRLDAAKHIYGDTLVGDIPEADILKNNDWWRAFSDDVYSVNPNAVLVGEVMGSLETMRRHAYGLDEELNDSSMGDARSRIAFPSAGFLGRWTDSLRACREVNRPAHTGPGTRPRSEPFQPFFFLASHDANPRLASFLEDMKQRGMQPGVDQAYRVGMVLLMSLAKYPVLYEGDELMQRGFKWNGNPPGAQPPGDGSNIFDETLREPFPWWKAGFEAPQTDWFHPRFRRPDDGVSVEEEDAPGSMLDLVRGLTNLRTGHPEFANGEIGAILNDSSDWLVFEKAGGQDSYLALINTTATGHNYDFHEAWFPRYIGAQLIFWSDGQARNWKNETQSHKAIGRSVFVPPYGFVLLRQQRP